ncbi:hypothetical protein FSP39_023950, partial [Pinctada imbricata]
EMRNQDVHLMKQLISINSSLRELSKERRQSLSRSCSRSSLYSLLRRKSNESIGSVKDYCGSNNDVSSDSGSETESENNQQFTTMPSVAMFLPEKESSSGEDYYRDILMTNVKLWKHSVSDDTDGDS